MTEGKLAPEQPNQFTVENARVGYQVAVALWTYEGEQNWARFNVMLVANSVLIAAVTLAITSDPPILLLSAVLAVIGLILCLMWLLITHRGFDYQTYYVLSARELEEKYLNDPIATAARGRDFAEGCRVSFELRHGPSSHRMGWFGRIASAGHTAQLVIALFAVIYVFVILQTVNILPCW